MKLSKNATRWIVVIVLFAVVSAVAQYQNRRGGRGRRSFGQNFEITNPERIREQEIMEQALNPEFREDTFTFARLHYVDSERNMRFRTMRSWEDDAPEADLNLIFRLHEVTSLKVRPGVNFIDITTKDLQRYPFVYMAGSGSVVFTEEEAADLGKYLLNGGFLMADDFWGDDQWAHLRGQMAQVLPHREPVELALTNRIFHTVYDFKQQPQIPSVGAYWQTGQSFDPGFPYYEKSSEPHYYAIYDDKQHMVALLCHNNHYGDGWEHEGHDESYFDKFSEPMGYPMFINILVYTMSH